VADLCVYGATGFTGKLVVAELQRRGVEAVLSGRSEEKLRALGTGWELRPAQVEDPESLRAAFRGCRAVLTCAGPFTFYGGPVIEAALDAGAHVLDTTGEQTYMQRVFEHMDAPAREREVALIPAVGFDYVPGDLAAALAARDAGGGPLRRMTLAYAVAGFGATRGTMRSALEMLGSEDLEYVDGDWRPAPAIPQRGEFAFPAPLGRQAVARYPGGEVVTVPRHVDTREVVQRITTSTFVPHPLLTAVFPAVGAARSVPLLGPGIDALIGRLPEGPGEEARRRAAFTIVAEAEPESGAPARVTVRGTDVYGLTAVIAVHAALLTLEPAFTATGALAPAQAFDVDAFLAHLAPHGLSVER
jgi:short subunit dehydrogenase-like uncharacterized protein